MYGNVVHVHVIKKNKKRTVGYRTIVDRFFPLPKSVHVNAWPALVLILTIRREANFISKNEIMMGSTCLYKWPIEKNR